MLRPDQAVRPLADVLRDNAQAFAAHAGIVAPRRGKGAGAAQPRAARGAFAVARGAGARRLCAPLPRRSSFAQHRRDRRRAGAVRRHRVRRPARHHRRPLRSRVPADGSRQARARARTPTPCSTPISMPRAAPAISSGSRAAAVPVDAGGDQGQGRDVAGGHRRRRTQADAARDEARAYFALAQRLSGAGHAAPRRDRRIVGISGKSAVARAIAPFVGAFPGAVHRAKRCRAQAPVRRVPKRTGCRPAPMRRTCPTASMPCAASVR